MRKKTKSECVLWWDDYASKNWWKLWIFEEEDMSTASLSCNDRSEYEKTDLKLIQSWYVRTQEIDIAWYDFNAVYCKKNDIHI